LESISFAATGLCSVDELIPGFEKETALKLASRAEVTDFFTGFFAETAFPRGIPFPDLAAATVFPATVFPDPLPFTKSGRAPPADFDETDFDAADFATAGFATNFAVAIFDIATLGMILGTPFWSSRYAPAGRIYKQAAGHYIFSRFFRQISGLCRASARRSGRAITG
jgi:hypothetical protein